MLCTKAMHRFVFLLALLTSSTALAQAQTETAVDPEPAEEPRAAGAGGRFRTGLEEQRGSVTRRGERVEFNVEDGDLPDLVRMMMSITGRRFVISGVQRTVRATVASTAPVTPGEAYQAFLAVLHANGLTVERRGRFHHIVENDDVSRLLTRIRDDGDALSADERYVTWIHRLSHVSASEAAQLIEPLRSPASHAVTYDATQTLILTDTGASIRRLRRILREIDVPRSDAQLWVEPIHYASAEDIAGLLEQIFESEAPSGAAPRAQAARPARPQRPTAQRPNAQRPAAASSTTTAAAAAAPLRILPDPRTNSLILLTNQPTYQRVMRLLRVLDRPDGEQLSVHVRRLQHGDAEAVASTLQALLGQSSGGAAQRPGGQAAATSEVNGEVRVQPHADLNAIVVTASRADYRAIEDLIAELDTAPRQVFLEMVLMEVTVNDTNSLDADIFTGLAGLFGGDVLGLLTSLGTGVDPTGPGTSLSLFGALVTDSRLPDGSIPEFGVQLQALAERTRANIIATPHITALDNREATINIGENVPLQSSAVAGSFLTSALAGQDASAAQSALSNLAGGANGGRRDTGTIVTVTPHINDDGEIRMEIRAEDSRQSSTSGNLGAATLAQSIAETELVARDGETVVIGGLTRESSEQVRTGIPILSEIPILGWLFGSTEDRDVKRNLLFFVTPHVIRDPSDMRAILERRLRERRELLERAMAFDDEWEPPIDYRRTRGLVGEMLTSIDAMNEEAERAAMRRETPPEHVERPPLDAEPDPTAELDEDSTEEEVPPDEE